MRPDAIDWTQKDNVSLAFVPRQRMHRTLWRWIIVIAFGQAVLAGVLLVALQGPWRQQARLDHATALVETAVEHLDRRNFRADQVGTNRTLQRLAGTDGVAFAAIFDATDNLVAATDEPGELTTLWQPEAPPPRSEAGGNLVGIDPVRNLIVLDAPLIDPDAHGGYRLVMGVHDRGAQRAIIDGSFAIIVALVAIALGLLPLAYFRLRRWTLGLSRLHTAIRNLAQGAEPKPLAIGGEDEVAYLSIAFNDMASQLLASRRALVQANKDLEHRVELRTQELRTASQRLEKLATSDMLTGLPNRRALTTQLQTMFEDAVRNDEDLVCVAVDLDGFKSINDHLGHASGDQVLQIASDVFRDACRTTDLIVRLGGDEFVILVALEGPEAAIPLGERLLREFRQRCADRFKGADLPRLPSMSIGIASRKQTHVVEAEQLLQAADSALYRAKDAGKACIELWRPSDRRPNSSDEPVSAPAGHRPDAPDARQDADAPHHHTTPTTHQ